MPDNDESVYGDLVGFLKSDRPDLRAKAAEAALIAVVDPAGAASLVRCGAVAPLCKMASVPGPVGFDALSSLLELSSGGPRRPRSYRT